MKRRNLGQTLETTDTATVSPPRLDPSAPPPGDRRRARSLLLIGAAVHACGSFAAYPMGSLTLVWSLSGSGLAALLAVLNLLRAARPQDRTLAWICAGGCLFWALIGLAFGVAIDHLLDPQVVFHVVVAAALADCSVVTAMRKDATPAETSSSPVIAAPAVRAVDLPVSGLCDRPSSAARRSPPTCASCAARRRNRERGTIPISSFARLSGA